MSGVEESMAEDLGKQLSGLWDRFRKKAADSVAQQSVALVRGRPAARDVFDDAGNLLVGAGHVIDEAAIERASAAGKMPALVAAAAAAQSQDLQEKLKGAYERTPEGQDQRNLEDSDEYLEARRYIRYVAAVEVTDIRGAVLVPAGKVIEDADVRLVRDAGQLAALIYSAQKSGPPPLGDTIGTAPPPATDLPPRRRTAVPLGETFEEDPPS
jgi:hypothetical protein